MAVPRQQGEARQDSGVWEAIGSCTGASSLLTSDFGHDLAVTSSAGRTEL